MSPYKSSIHRRPRVDSGAARLWAWARKRRGPWTCPEAAEAAGMSSRRCRAVVEALAEAGLLEQTRASELDGAAGQVPAEWQLSAAGRAMVAAPVLIVDGASGAITGIREAGDGTGVDILRAARAASGLTVAAMAARLGVHEQTLYRWLSGRHPVGADEPAVQLARRLK